MGWECAGVGALSMACVQVWCCIVFRFCGMSATVGVITLNARFFFFLFAPRWFAMGAVPFLNELHVV